MVPLRSPGRTRSWYTTTGLMLFWIGGPVLAVDETLTGLSIEQLMDMEVVSASKYAQRIADAPASVTVLRATDIRRFGYRTLADILRSVRGFYVSSDHQYNYIGVRGFSPPGDYNTRLLVLVDGYRINDNVYDTGAISGEFPLDVDLIDRVEVVRGPSSSVYGSNALFGVVNVITRRGRDFDGGEAAAAVSSHQGREGRVSWGKHLESGLDVVLSASGLRDQGATLHFPEFDAVNGGITRKTDFEQRGQFLAKMEYGGWNLTLMHSRRDKGAPGGAFGTDFDDRGNHLIDGQDSVNLGYYGTLENGTEASARVFAGNYRYRGYYIYSGVTNEDATEGSWWGGEVRFVTTLDRHKLVYGGEYQRNGRQDQRNFDQDPYQLYLDDRRHSSRHGFFVQDDFSFAERWTLSAGLRLDHSTSTSGNVSPRLGLIHQMDEGSVAKLLYGSAYRTPNVYERYYAYPGQVIANPDLRSERIKTYEAVWEKDIGQELHLVASAYYYRLENWIVQQADPLTGGAPYQFANQSPVSARGAEFEADRQWRDGTRLRASYAAQFGKEHIAGSLNQAPRHLVKANLSTPLWNPSWRASAEYQYTSSRATLFGRVGDNHLVNATLLYAPSPRSPQLAFSLYNLLDKRYADPNMDTGLAIRDRIPQEGLTWRLKLTLPF